MSVIHVDFNKRPEPLSKLQADIISMETSKEMLKGQIRVLAAQGEALQSMIEQIEYTLAFAYQQLDGGAA